MSHTWQKIKSLSDEELIAAHDKVSANTVVGVQYYLDELRYRSQNRIVEEQSRIAERVERYTKYLFWLTIAIAIATLINILVAVFGVIREQGVGWWCW